jgi:usherin
VVIYYLIIIIIFASKLLHTAKSQDLSYIVKGLKPYRKYSFIVSLCNSIGCVTSASGAGQTLAAGK